MFSSIQVLHSSSERGKKRVDFVGNDNCIGKDGSGHISDAGRRAGGGFSQT